MKPRWSRRDGYRNPAPRASGALWRAARAIERSRRCATDLPSVFVFTDPDRSGDLERLAARLPPGTGLVYRGFGAPDAAGTGRRLAAIARRRGLVLLVGADPGLAAQVGADGVHLPERLIGRIGTARRRHRHWRVTAAAHSLAAARRALRFGADAVFVSPVFKSNSPSAGRPLGVVRFAGLCLRAGGAVFALGGVHAGTAARLAGVKIAGIAGVEAFVGPGR